jgi:hypothetical protein
MLFEKQYDLKVYPKIKARLGDGISAELSMFFNKFMKIMNNDKKIV